MEESKKQGKNLFKKLLTDANSVFYSAEKNNKTLLNKAKKSFYAKRKVFYKLYARIEDQNIFDDVKVKVPFYIPYFLNKKRILIVHLHSIVLKDHSNYFMQVLQISGFF